MCEARAVKPIKHTVSNKVKDRNKVIMINKKEL